MNKKHANPRIAFIVIFLLMATVIVATSQQKTTEKEFFAPTDTVLTVTDVDGDDNSIYMRFNQDSGKWEFSKNQKKWVDDSNSPAMASFDFEGEKYGTTGNTQLGHYVDQMLQVNNKYKTPNTRFTAGTTFSNNFVNGDDNDHSTVQNDFIIKSTKKVVDVPGRLGTTYQTDTIGDTALAGNSPANNNIVSRGFYGTPPRISSTPVSDQSQEDLRNSNLMIQSIDLSSTSGFSAVRDPDSGRVYWVPSGMNLNTARNTQIKNGNGDTTSAAITNEDIHSYINTWDNGDYVISTIEPGQDATQQGNRDYRSIDDGKLFNLGEKTVHSAKTTPTTVTPPSTTPNPATGTQTTPGGTSTNHVSGNSMSEVENIINSANKWEDLSEEDQTRLTASTGDVVDEGSFQLLKQEIRGSASNPSTPLTDEQIVQQRIESEISNTPAQSSKESASQYAKLDKIISTKAGLTTQQRNKIRATTAIDFAQRGQHIISAKFYNSIGDYESAAYQFEAGGDYSSALSSYARYGRTGELGEGPIISETTISYYQNMINGMSTDDPKRANLETKLQTVRNRNYINTKPKNMEKAYNFINKYTLSWSSGYAGASFFYNDDDNWIYDDLDEDMQNWLGGIDGWASEICKGEVLEDVTGNNGYAFSNTVNGAYAHIEGEKITVTNYTNTSSETFYYYKVSFQVSPGTGSSGCGLKFKTYYDKSSTTPIVIGNISGTAYQWDLDRGDKPISYTGSNMVFEQSTNQYSEVCIYFEEINPRAGTSCLIGTEEGEYLCNTITAGAEQTFTNFNCEFCDTLEDVFSLGGQGGEDSSSPNPGSTNQGTATVNTGI